MLSSWRIGKVFGIAVYVHWSFVLVPLLVFFSSREAGLLAALVMVALALAVFGCVLLHEFGHALTARAYGIRSRDITLYPIGGVARLEGIPPRPVEELFIALAGPAVNLAIAFVLAVVLVLLGVSHFVLVPGADAGPPGASFIANLLLANLILAFFNLLPAFPMDGGRVLRSLLALWLGRLRATEVAARVGVMMALLIATLLPLGIYWAFEEFTPMPVLVGLFVIYAGQRELWMVRRAEAARDEDPPEVLPAEEEWPGPLRIRVVRTNGRPLPHPPEGTE
jgi:Zn-dependent protease